jgi:dCTP diphosphatase
VSDGAPSSANPEPIGTGSTDRLAAIVLSLRDFTVERDWGHFHDPKNLAMLLCSETGELAAELRWVANADADEWLREPGARRRVEAEIADVAIALLLLVDRTGIDLLSAIEAKVEMNRRNYPVESARGNSERPR